MNTTHLSPKDLVAARCLSTLENSDLVAIPNSDDCVLAQQQFLTDFGRAAMMGLFKRWFWSVPRRMTS